MATAIDLFKQSELALAAYALNLSKGILSDDYVTALVDAGLSKAQAKSFADTYAVVEQYTAPISGASMTVFKDKTSGQLYLACRGTEADAGDLVADAILLAGVAASLNSQYLVLCAVLKAWLATDGILSGVTTLTAAGHSLGGYLAEALKNTYADTITTAYLFNAPGNAGFVGNIAELVSGLFTQTTVWNVKGSEGLSLISGIGSQASATLSIQTEAASALGLGNHSVVRLTDALAVQSVYAALDATLTQAQLNPLIDASGSSANDILESWQGRTPRVFPARHRSLREYRSGPKATLFARQSRAPTRTSACSARAKIDFIKNGTRA